MFYIIGGPPTHRSSYGQTRTGTNLTITPSVTITPTTVPPRKDVMVSVISVNVRVLVRLNNVLTNRFICSKSIYWIMLRN